MTWFLYIYGVRLTQLLSSSLHVCYVYTCNFRYFFSILAGGQDFGSDISIPCPLLPFTFYESGLTKCSFDK